MCVIISLSAGRSCDEEAKVFWVIPEFRIIETLKMLNCGYNGFSELFSIYLKAFDQVEILYIIVF